LLNITVNEEYRKLLPPLSREEYETLKTSIRERGLLFPIIVNRDGVILDGHHRYRACLELGVEPKIEVKIFNSPLHEKIFIIESNLRRRHLNEFQKAELTLRLIELEKQLAEELSKANLTDFEKAELAYPLLEVERELAKQRRSDSIPKKGEKGFQPVSGSIDPNIGRARDIVAKKVGLSPKTFQRAVAILERAPEDLKEKVRRGRVSISYAYKMVMRRERPATPPLPEGEFNVIYADLRLLISPETTTSYSLFPISLTFKRTLSLPPE